MIKNNNVVVASFYIIISLLLFSCKAVNNRCASIYDEELKRYIYVSYDTVPQYSGGIIALSRLALNDLTIEDNIFQTKVFVLIVISETGELLDIRIRNKKRSNYSNLEKKVIKNLQTMKNWTPAQCVNKKVSSYYVFPINLHYD